MKHETLNSIVALLGLGLAAITAWHQFGPKSDTITLVSEGRVETGTPLEIQPFGTLDEITGERQPVAGPVTWKVRVHNTSHHSVSLVSYELLHLGEDDSLIYYSAMRERLSPNNPTLPVQSLPDNIPLNESRAYFVSLFVPFQADQDMDNACGDAVETIQELEYCFHEKGRDMFGNQAETIEQGGLRHTVVETFSAPKFLLVLQTADGSTFGAELTFLPY